MFESPHNTHCSLLETPFSSLNRHRSSSPPSDDLLLFVRQVGVDSENLAETNKPRERESGNSIPRVTDPATITFMACPARLIDEGDGEPQLP